MTGWIGVGGRVDGACDDLFGAAVAPMASTPPDQLETTVSECERLDGRAA